jgi:hypothetical protein
VRIAAIAVCLVLIGAAAASAATGGNDVHGRGIRSEAALDARVLDTGRRPIQILDRLCRIPETRQGCAPASTPLRRAISRAVDRPIAWVHHRRAHGGTLWVLAPIRWTPKTASLRYAWDEPGAGGCFGGGQLRYQRERGSWKLTWGIAYEGCSVTSAGGSSASA